MKAILFLLALCSLAFAATEEEFKSWMDTHGKIYDDQVEYQKRFSIYQDNERIVGDLNKNTYNVTYGLNNLADLTAEEFKRMLGARPTGIVAEAVDNAPIVGAPSKFDWCGSGHCTPVKDQGQCGSCWAFATTENIESVNSIAGHGLKVLAPQQIVDCDSAEAGCGGGDPRQAYTYVVRQGGLDLESYYPYTGVKGGCRYSGAHVGVKIAGERDGYGGSEEQMAANLASIAPFSIIVDASRWQFYKSGVLPSSQCGKSLDHAVVAVGYDTSSSPPYWRVRNSWSAGWGESGFIRLEYNKDTCGIRTEVLTSRL